MRHLPGRDLRALLSLGFRRQQWRQESCSVAAFRHRNGFRRALGNNDPPTIATLRPHIDNPVGGFNYLKVMLDHHHGITVIHERVQHLEQLAHILEMQTGRGLVQYIECASGGALG